MLMTGAEYRSSIRDGREVGMNGEHLKGVFLVSTGLIVNDLARPEMLMEIDVDAVILEEET
jgi:hypothetical protein